MGFESSVVLAIFFISAMVMATASYATISSSQEMLLSSTDEHYSLLNRKLQTDVQIVQSTTNLQNSTYQLSLQVLNTGSETLRSDETDVLVDGVFMPYSSTNATTLWTPQTYMTLNIYNLSGFGQHRVKVVTENGVCDYLSYFI